MILSERGINIHFYPIVGARGKDLSKDYIRYKNGNIDFIAKEGSRWDYNCYRLMDFLSTKIRERFDQICLRQMGKIIKHDDLLNLHNAILLHSPNRLQELDPRNICNNSQTKEMREFYSSDFEVSIKEMLKSPCFQGLDGYAIKKIIKKASDCSVKVNWYFKSESKIKEGYTSYDFKHTYSNLDGEFDQLFNFEFKEGVRGKDGKSYSNICNFKFDTILSSIFIHNIVTGGYSLIEEPFYSLSRYANILFRMFILNYTNQRTILDMNTVTHRLGLIYSNPSALKKRFTNLILELYEHRLISLEETEINGSCIRYVVKRKNNKK